MQRFIGYFVAAIVFMTTTVFGQPADAPLRFEVASVKPADPHTQSVSASRDAGEGLDVRNISVRNLITLAYGLRDFQLLGAPGWIDTESYDVLAKAPPSDSQTGTESLDQRTLRFDRVKERLRSLLADRFGLVVHHETREQSVYFLTVAKNGLKLKEVLAPEGPLRKEEGRGHSRGFAVPVDMLVTTLANATHTTVVDRTGLPGRYDYALDWDPDFQGDTGPTIFTAVQEQLGLRLESGKAPVDVVVIDHVERPSAN